MSNLKGRADVYKKLLERYKENSFDPKRNRAIQFLSNDFFVPRWREIKEEVLGK